MKISKFRDIDSYKEKEYKERVASTLDQINQQTIQNTEEVKSAIDNHITSLSNQSIDNTNNIIASVDEDLEIIKQTLSGVAPKSETTVIVSFSSIKFMKAFTFFKKIMSLLLRSISPSLAKIIYSFPFRSFEEYLISLIIFEFVEISSSASKFIF